MALYDGTNYYRVYVELSSTISFSSYKQIATADVRSINIRRGRSREDQAIQPGNCTIVLDNHSGIYDPDTTSVPTSSLYVGSNGRSIIARNYWIRIRCVLDYVNDETIFMGKIETVSMDVEFDQTFTINATDSAAFMSRSIYPGRSTLEVGHTRAGKILDDYGWPTTISGKNYRNLYLSSYLMDSQGSKSHLDALEEVIASEGGIFFISKDAVATTYNYDNLYNPTYWYTLDDQRTAGTIEYDSIDISNGDLYIYNQVVLKYGPDGANSYTANANASGQQTQYGVFTKTVNGCGFYGSSSSYNYSFVASHLAYQNSIPKPRIIKLGYSMLGLSTSLQYAVLNQDIADQVTANRTLVDGRSFSQNLNINQIAYDITPEDWRVTIDTYPSATQP